MQAQYVLVSIITLSMAMSLGHGTSVAAEAHSDEVPTVFISDAPPFDAENGRELAEVVTGFEMIYLPNEAGTDTQLVCAIVTEARPGVYADTVPVDGMGRPLILLDDDITLLSAEKILEEYAEFCPHNPVAFAF